MDDANPKQRKPLTPQRQLKRVLDAVGDVADDALAEGKPLSKRERLKLKELKESLIKKAENYDAELDRQAAEPGWSKKTRKKETPDSGYEM